MLQGKNVPYLCPKVNYCQLNSLLQCISTKENIEYTECLEKMEKAWSTVHCKKNTLAFFKAQQNKPH